jgi:arginine decarboxylase
MASMLKTALDTWSTADAAQLYEVARWGQGYFSVSPSGHLLVHPHRDPQQAIDLKELVDRLQLRGLDLPVLIRFNDILQDRLREIRDTFAQAFEENEYTGTYTCVYPIKVNQQRQVVEKIVEYGRQYGFGLEAGSKPELLAVVAMSYDNMPIICNGFKDSEFIEMAMLAHKIGRRVIPVVEKFSELQLILHHAANVGVRPQIGVRVKLATRGSGRWQSSGGYRSKFGLTIAETLALFEELRQLNMTDCLKMLHFHLGSQITDIRQIKAAVMEASRIYVDLYKRGAGLEYLNVGGGLGVDYDGSQTNFESSVNYTLREYANAIANSIKPACEAEGVPHPNIISESGRAIVAYHSALIFDVLGVTELACSDNNTLDVNVDEVEQPVAELYETYQNLSVRNMLESFHAAQQSLDNCMNLFALGHLSLDQRATAEKLFWRICFRIRKLVDDLDYTPEELENLDRLLADTYFCNFSIFQSIPDSWAIKQLFPIVPIHRLNERPTRFAVLGDITCDSDGKVDQFIDRRDVRRTLPLHPVNGKPYYLGAFLVGAYQEILGDLHNLFGDTNAVHVALQPDGEAVLETVVKGETVSEVLDYVQYNRDDLITRLQTAVERAVRANRLSHQEAGRFVKFYEDALNGYTYLEKRDE